MYLNFLVADPDPGSGDPDPESFWPWLRDPESF